jgi:hypothetical protein
MSQILTPRAWYMGLQIAIAKPFLAFPMEMVLVPIVLGANLVLHDIST